MYILLWLVKKPISDCAYRFKFFFIILIFFSMYMGIITILYYIYLFSPYPIPRITHFHSPIYQLRWFWLTTQFLIFTLFICTYVTTILFSNLKSRIVYYIIVIIIGLSVYFMYQQIVHVSNYAFSQTFLLPIYYCLYIQN